jgi:alanine dehydrogenase
MKIGVPRETRHNEHRVGLTPFGVGSLANGQHEIFVEHDAGAAGHFVDADYAKANGKVAYNTEEVFQRADLVCRVGRLSNEETDMLRPGSTLCGFLHLAVTPKEQLKELKKKEVTLIGYEIVHNAEGRCPVLVALSEIAGPLAIHTAARLLEHGAGGRGVLLGAVPGIPAATVVILGAGTAGQAAARAALGVGAHVVLLDKDIERLRQAHASFLGRAVTVLASPGNLARFTAVADLLIGAVLTPGERSPDLVNEAMVESMKQGSVIIDLSIDQGGCIETSRPTTLDNPTFKQHGVTHYCVPNISSEVPRTASRALTIAALPFVTGLANKGVDVALKEDPGLARGVYIYRGHVVNPFVAKAMGEEPESLAELLR